MAEKGSPGGTVSENVRDARHGPGFVFVCCMERIARGTRHAGKPERNPEKARGTERDEVRAPAVTLHERAAKEQAESGTGADAGVDEGIDEAAVAQRKMAHDDSGEAWIGGGFSDAEKKAAQEECRESTRETGEKSGSGPDGESDGEDFSRGKTVGKPTGENQERSVGPEKCGEENAELGRSDGKFALESWGGDGKRAAVDIGDEEGEEEKDENGPENGREFFGWSRGVQGAEIVQQEREREQ